MENTLRLACIQTTSNDAMESNAATLLAQMEEACAQGAALIALPENAFLMRGSDEVLPPLFSMDTHPGVALCRELAAKRGVWILIGSVFISSPVHPGQWYNRSVLINSSGAIVAEYDKIHLFDVTLADERDYKESARVIAGDRMVCAPTPWGGLGLSICYDLRFPHLFRDLAKAGARIIAVPAAFTETTGKAHWHVLLRARAIETGCFIFAPAQCGEHPGGRRTYGHSLIISPWGEILAEGSAMTPEVVIAELHLAQVEATRASLPSLQHDTPYTK